MAYITLSDVTTFINAPSLTTPQQNQVTAIIPAVEAFLETACNRTWNVTAEQTETFDGGQTVYFPKHTPITTVGSITDDGVTQVENTDFYTYPTYIRFLSPTTNKPRCVVITYTPTETLPGDVKHAMVRWVSQIYKEAKDAGKPVAKVTMGPMAVEFLTKDGIPQFVAEVISRHRLRPI